MEVKDTPDTAAKITAAIGTIKVGGTAKAPVYDASGKDVTCSGDFDKATTPVSCTKVTGLPGEDNKQKEEMDKVLKDLKDSETINADNVDALKISTFDVFSISFSYLQQSQFNGGIFLTCSKIFYFLIILDFA